MTLSSKKGFHRIVSNKYILGPFYMNTLLQDFAICDSYKFK